MNGNSPFTPYVTYADIAPSSPSVRDTSSSPSSPRHFASYGDLSLGSPHLDEKKVKAIIRSQSWPVDHVIRTQLWPELCRRFNLGGANIYQEVIKGIFKDDDHDDCVELPGFVESAHMFHYHLNGQGRRAVKRLLCAIAVSNPHITFSPVLYSLSSLVLHYVTVEEGFNAVYSLLHKEGCFFTQARISYEASPYTLKELVKKHSKPCFLFLSRQTTQDVERVFENWIWWLFKDLPLFHLVRVIDCMLFEGSKVLYRVALALLMLFHKSVGKTKEQLPTSLETAISQFCENIPVSPEKLLKLAFGIRGLTRKHIRVLQLQHEMYLRSKTNVEHMVSSQTDPSRGAHNRVKLAKLPRSRSFASNPVPVDDFLTSSILNYDQLSRTLSVSRSRAHSLGWAILDSVASTIINLDHIQLLWKWLPLRMTVCQPELLYTSEEHGTSIRTLYNKVDEQGCTLIVIKTAKNEILGMYCSEDWSIRNKAVTRNSIKEMYARQSSVLNIVPGSIKTEPVSKVLGAYCSADWSERKQGSGHLSYFGTGETFLFTLAPTPAKYEWVGVNKTEDVGTKCSMFQAANSTMLSVGGGNGEGLRLDADLYQGFTSQCLTFNNPPLVEDSDFKVKAIEAFGFK